MITLLVLQAVSMLTGLERFVRLVVERESLVPRAEVPASGFAQSEKSPKVNLIQLVWIRIGCRKQLQSNRKLVLKTF